MSGDNSADQKLSGAEKIKEARMLWSMTCKCHCDGCMMVDKLLTEFCEAEYSSHEPRERVLNEFAANLHYWIDSYERREGVTDDTHVITPPSWPTVGLLKTWIKALKGESLETAKRQTTMSQDIAAQIEGGGSHGHNASNTGEKQNG